MSVRDAMKVKECGQSSEINKKEFEEKMQLLRKWKNEETEVDLKNMSGEMKCYVGCLKKDREVAWFLRGGGYDLDETKKLILTNIKLKQLRPKIFFNRDPLDPAIRAVWNVVYMMKMPLKSNCQSIVYIGFKNPDPSKFDMANTERLFHMCVDMLVKSGDLQESDFVMILDGKGTTLRHFSLHNLPQIKIALDYAQRGLPLTMSEIHVINASFVVRKIFFLTKPFIAKKFADKLKFHSSDHKLNQLVPPNILPYELGGTYGTLDQIQELTKESLENLRYWFIEESQKNDSRKIVLDVK